MQELQGSQEEPSPASLVALRQLYGGRIEAVSRLAGLFLHFSSRALIFPQQPPCPQPFLCCFLSFPSLICQPSQERATGLGVIELLRGGSWGSCALVLGFLPSERGRGGSSESGPQSTLPSTHPALPGLGFTPSGMGRSGPEQEEGEVLGPTDR